MALTMRGTQRKGDMATTRAIATFTQLGFDVSIPVTESAAYDLVVDDGSGLRRVQCKFSSGRHVDLRRIHSNSKGYVVKRVNPDAYDWLYVLSPDGAEFLIRQCLANRRAVTLNPKFQIGGVAEWSNAPVLKTGVRQPRTAGSNPAPSALPPGRLA
jgi:hypothetical protein